jgi:hypothetical protein
MLQPRQQYGLGSFVKKAVKGVTGAVKSAAGGIKDLASSDLGKAALLLGGGYLAGGGGMPQFLGGRGLGGFSFGKLPVVGGLFGAAPTGRDAFMGIAGKTRAAEGLSKFAKTGLAFAGGSLLPAVLGEAQQTGDVEEITRDVNALRTKLTNAYKLQRTFADEADEDSAIQEQVAADLSEYTSGAGGYANGGRIGYALGTNNPEQNAINASGIMGLPLNTNPAGATELDLRETGGFIPPVGVKEKEDDIPAMLSNNEFVFTADAVRGMGGGDVDRGAQRLYDQMKMLEKGGRV